MWETQVQSLIGMIPWRRKRQLTPVILLVEFHEQGCLVGYSPWGQKELDLTERLTVSFSGSHRRRSVSGKPTHCTHTQAVHKVHPSLLVCCNKTPQSDFNTTRVLSHSSGGDKSKIKVWQGLDPSEGTRERSAPGLSPSS